MKKTLPPISPDVDGHHLFLASDAKNYTYRDLFSFGVFFKAFIAEYDIDAGRPIGLHAHSSNASIFIIAACWLHNIPFASFNPKAKRDTLAKQINEIHPGLIVTDSPVKKLSDHIPTIPINRFDPLDKISRDRPQNSLSDFDQYDYRDKETFGYFFTSGTSGRPKVVPLKRRQMHAGARASAQNIEPGTNEAWLLCLPLYHIGGVSVVLRSLLYGSAIYRIDDFDIVQTGNILSKKENVVAASLVPTMLHRLLSDRAFATHQKFKAILLGGGPASPELVQKSVNRNIPIILSYGMTETCAQIAANPVFTAPKNTELLNSAGIVFAPNEIEIRNENDEAVTARNSGTIWLKGSQVFDGYQNTSTQNYFDEDGWFNTGDFGRLDANGNLYIEARRTDLIITGGENVSPFEVEAVLQKLDFINDAAVFGMPDEQWGQKVVAVIIFADGKEKSTKMIREALRKDLENYKIPKQIITMESLPRTETGKIKRSKLPALFNPQR